MPPLLVNPTTRQFWLPQTSDGIINMHRGDQVQLICETDFKGPNAGNQRILATCKDQQTFTANGGEQTIKSFECTSHYPTTLRPVPRGQEQTCANGAGVRAETGLDIGGGTFLRTMDICLNENKKFTYYVHYNLYPASNVFQQRCKVPNFDTGTFFGGNKRTFANFYAHGSIQQQFVKLLGQQSNVMFEGANAYFSPGHLMPRVDNIMAPDQRCTYYYANAAQQWHSFNSGT